MIESYVHADSMQLSQLATTCRTLGEAVLVALTVVVVVLELDPTREAVLVGIEGLPGQFLDDAAFGVGGHQDFQSMMVAVAYMNGRSRSTAWRNEITKSVASELVFCEK